MIVGLVGIAQPRRRFDQRLQDRLEIEGRAADDLEHVGGGGLLLQRFGQIFGALAQLVEQPRVLDGDHRLGGEILHQLDLLVGEGPDFLPVNDDRADQLVLLEHRHESADSRTAELDRANFSVAGRQVNAAWSADDCSVAWHASRGPRRWYRPPGAVYAAICRSPSADGEADISTVAVTQQSPPNLRVADAAPHFRASRRTPARSSPGELADDAQYLRGRRLLLQRFGEIVGALAQFVEQPRVLDRDDGLGGEVLSPARSACR